MERASVLAEVDRLTGPVTCAERALLRPPLNEPQLPRSNCWLRPMGARRRHE
jgi:hypothetical protein